MVSHFLKRGGEVEGRIGDFSEFTFRCTVVEGEEGERGDGGGKVEERLVE